MTRLETARAADHRIRRGVRRSLGAATLVTLVATGVGCSTSVPRADTSGTLTTETPTTKAPTTHAPETHAPTTRAAESTTTGRPALDPEEVVATVSMTGSDIPGQIRSQEPGEPLSHSTDPCKVISSSPFVAAAYSPTFVVFDDEHRTARSFSSLVAVQPSEADAASVVETMASDEWLQRCETSRSVESDQAIIDQKNAGSDCDISLVRHSEVAIPAGDLPDGVVGWSYNSVRHCGTDDADQAASVEKYITHVGPTVIEVIALGESGAYPTGRSAPITWTADQRHLIEKLRERARAAQT